MTLTPSYGRDYKSEKEVKADWEANKDFTIADIFGGQAGRQINKQDAPKGTYTIHYSKLTKVCVIKVK
jgi:hypothetical protein